MIEKQMDENKCICSSPLLYKQVYQNCCTHHSHFGEIQQAVGREVGRSLLNEGQIGQIHAQIWNAWRIAAVQRLAHSTESSIRTNDRLQFVDRLSDLQNGYWRHRHRMHTNF